MADIDIWNELGNLYYQAGALDEAIESYKKAIDQGYQSGDVFNNLAIAYTYRGNIRDAIPLYQKSVELLFDDKEKVLVLTRLGDCYRQIREYYNAIATYKMAIEIDPGNPSLIRGLTEVKRDLERIYRYDRHFEFSDPVIEMKTRHSNFEIAQGNGFRPRGMSATAEMNVGVGNVMEHELVPDDAREVTRETGSNYPESTEYFEFQENLEPALDDGTTAEISPAPQALEDEAVHDTDDVISTFPVRAESILEDEESMEMTISAIGTGDKLQNKDSKITVGISSDIEGDMEDNILPRDAFNLDELKLKEKEDGVRVTLLLTLGIMQWRNGKLDEADKILQSAIADSVKIQNNWFEALSYHALALVKTDLGNIVEAIDAYKRAMALAPDQILPWNNLGSLYGSMGCHNDAVMSFQKAIKLNPEDSTSWDGLGDVYTKLGRLDDAIAAYQLGNVFEKRAPGKDAVKTYEKAFEFHKYTIASLDDEPDVTRMTLEQDPEIKAAAEVLVDESADQGIVGVSSQLEDILVTSEKISPISGEEEVPGENEVAVLSQASEPELLKDSMEMGVGEQVESDEDSAEEPGEFGFDSGDLIDSSSLPETSSPESIIQEHELELDENELGKSKEIVTVNQGENPGQQNDPERIASSIASFQRVLEINPRNDRAWDSLGNLYRISQQNSDAINAFENAIEIDPKIYIYHYQLGTLYANEGNFDSAISEMRKVMELNPGFVFGHCAMAGYLRKMGFDEDAQKHIAVARPKMIYEKEYDRACFESICGNAEAAVELLRIALEKKQTTMEWISRDQDLDFIREQLSFQLLLAGFTNRIVEYEKEKSH